MPRKEGTTLDKKSEFYTLKGYKLKQHNELTESMEDYLEMIYRHTRDKKEISTKELSNYLNVLPSSTSKMIQRLKEQKFVLSEKYGVIQLTQEGEKIGKYLLWRHNTLTNFLKQLNQENFSLEQVEKIEHFIDFITLQNMVKYLEENTEK